MTFGVPLRQLQVRQRRPSIDCGERRCDARLTSSRRRRVGVNWRLGFTTTGLDGALFPDELDELEATERRAKPADQAAAGRVLDEADVRRTAKRVGLEPKSVRAAALKQATAGRIMRRCFTQSLFKFTARKKPGVDFGTMTRVDKPAPIESLPPHGRHRRVRP